MSPSFGSYELCTVTVVIGTVASACHHALTNPHPNNHMHTKSSLTLAAPAVSVCGWLCAWSGDSWFPGWLSPVGSPLHPDDMLWPLSQPCLHCFAILVSASVAWPACCYLCHHFSHCHRIGLVSADTLYGTVLTTYVSAYKSWIGLLTLHKFPLFHLLATPQHHLRQFCC